MMYLLFMFFSVTFVDIAEREVCDPNSTACVLTGPLSSHLGKFIYPHYKVLQSHGAMTCAAIKGWAFRPLSRVVPCQR